MAVVGEVLNWLDNSSNAKCDKENIFKEKLIEQPDNGSAGANNYSSVPHNDNRSLSFVVWAIEPSGFLGDGSIQIHGTTISPVSHVIMRPHYQGK